MRVLVEHGKFYDFVPLEPGDPEPKPEDIAAGHIRPNARGSGFLKKVTRIAAGGTQTMVHIPEDAIVHKMLDNLHPTNGRATITRKEAVAQILQRNSLPNHMHPKWITNFVVEDDGPDEATFRRVAEPFAKLRRGGTDEMVVEDFDGLLAAYLEPAKPADHKAHLHGRFGLKA